MKSLIVYDSLHGNTRVVAEAIADGVSGEVEVVHVDDASVPALDAYDLLIVGAPTHAAKPSPNAQAFLEKIGAGALKGVRVSAFDTRMTKKWITIFGVAAPKIAKALKARGGTPAGRPQGFYVTGGEGPLREGEPERAAAWARGLVGDQA